jgi:hypothetical protein
VAEIFRFLRGEKMFCGGVEVLLGICQFLTCFVMVLRGAFVVNCVVNVVGWMSLFRGLKMGQVFELYFWMGVGEGFYAAKARSARGLFSQTVPKPLGAVSHSLWNSVRSGPSPLLLHHNIIS